MNKLVTLFILLAGTLHAGCSEDTPGIDNNGGDGQEGITNTEHPIREIPTGYTSPASREGKVVRLDYTTPSYTSPGVMLNKYAYVYLPYGYDENDNTKSYNIFYLLHGGGGNAGRYLGGEGQSTDLKRILDNMIENNDMEPLIVVTPTFYPPDNNSSSVANSGVAVRNFPAEVRDDLIPVVESTYHSFAQSTTAEGLTASRQHRGFGGFSMGSVATWYTFIDCLDYFRYFLPMSGDCWAIAQQGGASRPSETAEYLANVFRQSGYTTNDFFIYALTGTSDIAYDPMNNQVNAMKAHPEFMFEEDFTKGNIYFNVLEGGAHTYEYVLRYIYNALPVFWQ